MSEQGPDPTRVTSRLRAALERVDEALSELDEVVEEAAELEASLRAAGEAGLFDLDR